MTVGAAGFSETSVNNVADLNFTFMRPCIVNVFKYNNKMQCYTMVVITINALHVSGGYSAHHQELKNCIHIIVYLSSFYFFLPQAVGKR